MGDTDRTQLNQRNGKRASPDRLVGGRGRRVAVEHFLDAGTGAVVYLRWRGDRPRTGLRIAGLRVAALAVLIILALSLALWLSDCDADPAAQRRDACRLGFFQFGGEIGRAHV